MPATCSDHRHRTAWRRAISAAVVAATLLGAAGCSSPAPKEQELSEALVASGLSQDVADCAASALTKSLTPSELAAITERGAGGAPVDDPKVDDESADKLTAAMATCRELQIANQPTTTVAVPAETEGAGGSTTVAPGASDGAELNPASTTTP